MLCFFLIADPSIHRNAGQLAVAALAEGCAIQRSFRGTTGQIRCAHHVGAARSRRAVHTHAQAVHCDSHCAVSLIHLSSPHIHQRHRIHGQPMQTGVKLSRDTKRYTVVFCCMLDFSRHKFTYSKFYADSL